MAATVRPYTLKVLHPLFGAIISGINLTQQVPQSTIDQIRRDVHQYRLLIFKQPGPVPAEAQLRVSRWFGQVQSTFYRHPASPDLGEAAC